MHSGLNPNVKQTIKKTICVPNWTDTVRPPTSYTNKLKVQGIADTAMPTNRSAISTRTT
jgi:hypothetical protein